MEFSLGQEVKFVDKAGTATIMALYAKGADVLSEDGFEEFHLFSELLPIADLEIPEIPIEVKEEQLKSSPPKTKPKIAEKTLDLHFGHLVDYPDAYTAHEKLLKQLEVFQKELEVNIQLGVKKMIVIHGKGTGKLRQEIETILKNNKIDYVDADIRRYKLGALQLNLQK